MKNTNEVKLAPVVFVSPEALKAEAKTKPQRNPNDLIIMNAEVSRNGQRYAFIPVSEIDIDLDYQREQSEKAVDSLVAGWNEERYEPIHVAYRDGRFKAWDGGKRLRAQIKMGRDNVYCKLCNFDTLKAEITAYIEQTKYVTRISPADLFKAKLFRGDEMPTMIKKVCDEYGIDIKLNGSRSHHIVNTITNISRFQRTAQTVKENGIRWIFDTVKAMNLDKKGKDGYNTTFLMVLGAIYAHPIASFATIQNKLAEFGVAHPYWHTGSYRAAAKREYPTLNDEPAMVNLLESIVLGKTDWAK